MAQLYNNYILYIAESIDISVIEGWNNPTTTDLLAGWDICTTKIYRTFLLISYLCLNEQAWVFNKWIGITYGTVA